MQRLRRIQQGQQRGSVLILVPAGVLVLLILGAICVDLSIAYLAHRQLQDAASTAVNDAAGAALDQARLRAGDGTATLDPDLARRVALASLAAGVHGPVHITASPVVEVTGTRVTVRLEGDAPYVFSGAIPGAPKRVHVRAIASGDLEEG